MGAKADKMNTVFFLSYFTFVSLTVHMGHASRTPPIYVTQFNYSCELHLSSPRRWF